LTGWAQLNEVQIAEPIDSLGIARKIMRYIGEDYFTSPSGIKYRIDPKGRIDLDYGFRTLNIAANPLVVWTGNPATFANRWAMAGGANKFLSRKRMVHIMKRHFHPKSYGKGEYASKGYWFCRAMNEKMLKKYINRTVRKGTPFHNKKRGSIKFIKHMKNPEGVYREYVVVTDVNGFVKTAFPKPIK
jgi:hypothetical protein